MKQRIPIAILIVVLTLVCCLLGPLPRLIFLSLCGLAATWESWSILSRDRGSYVIILLVFLAVCAVLSVLRLSLFAYGAAFFLTAHVILIRGALTYGAEKGKDVLTALAVLVYPAALFGALLYISQLENWLWPFALGQLTAWICDSAALVVGKRWGKRPLPTPVSPHKTVEGCLAGAVAALPTGLLCWGLFRGSCPLSLWAWMLLCLLVSTWGQLGDLAASLVKRVCGAKDFSGLLGPHGGVMDKFDSMVFSIPLAYFCLRIMGVM